MANQILNLTKKSYSILPLQSWRNNWF